MSKGNKKGGSSSRNQTTTTTTEPPKYLQPYLQDAVSQAQGLYRQGPQQYYPGQTVVGFSPETEEALGIVSDRARSGSPMLSAANSFATGVLNGGGAPTFGAGSNPYAANVYRAPGSNPYASSAYQAPGANPYASAVGTNSGPNPYASSVFRDPGANPYATNAYSEAQNNFGAASNPALDATFNKAADATQTRLASQFAGSGRNIDASRPARAEELAGLATDIYGGAYENERNRELTASQNSADRGLSAYLQARQTGANSWDATQGREQNAALAAQGYGAQGYESSQSRALQAALAAQGIGADSLEAERQRQQQAGLTAQGIGADSYEAERQREQSGATNAQSIGATGYESERDRLASELGQQRQQQLGVLGLAPSLASSDYADADRLAQVGATREDLTGRGYQDAASRWDFGQGAAGNALDQYLARLSGYPGGMTSSSTPIYRNPVAGGLGGAGLGYQIGSNIGTGYGGWGALLGGLLGAYGG